MQIGDVKTTENRKKSVMISTVEGKKGKSTQTSHRWDNSRRMNEVPEQLAVTATPAGGSQAEDADKLEGV